MLVLPDRAYLVAVVGPDRPAEPRQDLFIGEGERHDGLDFRLIEGTRLHGRVAIPAGGGALRPGEPAGRGGPGGTALGARKTRNACAPLDPARTLDARGGLRGPARAPGSTRSPPPVPSRESDDPRRRFGGVRPELPRGPRPPAGPPERGRGRGRPRRGRAAEGRRHHPVPRDPDPGRQDRRGRAVLRSSGPTATPASMSSAGGVVAAVKVAKGVGEIKVVLGPSATASGRVVDASGATVRRRGGPRHGDERRPRRPAEDLQHDPPLQIRGGRALRVQRARPRRRVQGDRPPRPGLRGPIKTFLVPGPGKIDLGEFVVPAGRP